MYSFILSREKRTSDTPAASAPPGNKVWLANDGVGEDCCVWEISWEALLDESTDRITLTEYFIPECRASFCCAAGGYLWIGEFCGAGGYETKESHRFAMPSGEEHRALICGYALDGADGAVSDVPDRILSVTDLAQGFAVNADGELALSLSYGLSSSRLLFYENVFELRCGHFSANRREARPRMVSRQREPEAGACPTADERGDRVFRRQTACAF